MNLIHQVQRILFKFEGFGFDEHSLEHGNAVGLWACEQASLVWLALQADPTADWVEIGSFHGGGTVLLCLARRELQSGPTVYAVDRDFNTWNGAWHRNVMRVGKFQDICTPLSIYSSEFAKQYVGKKISLVFHDGWHSFKSIIEDFLSLEKFIIPGGYYLIHDCSPQPLSKLQINEFYQEAKQNFDTWTSEELSEWSTKDYFLAEKKQNFFTDHAACWIAREYNYKVVDLYIPEYKPYLDRTGHKYIRGKTSPNHGLIALQKC